MKKYAALVLGLLILSLIPLTSETIVVKETIKGKTTETSIEVTRMEDAGLFWEIATSKDSVSKSGKDAEGNLMVFEVEEPEGNWKLTSDGQTLRSSGTYKGKALDGSVALEGRIWSCGFDQPLSVYVLQKKKGQLKFLMINPVEMEKSTEMTLAADGKDKINDNAVTRFKLSLPGAMAMFWSAKIWADPDTGYQVKYQGNKGPGTSDTVVVMERM